MNHYGVIMAGGGGTRFWPLSRQKTPKQLLNLTGNDLMINEAVDRIASVIDTGNIYIVTSELQTPAMIQATQGKVLPENILAEPAARNTAACIGLAAIEILKKHGDGVMVITPADHYIKDVLSLTETFGKAIQIAEEQDKMVTIGLKPTFPSSGFGYIHFDTKKSGSVKPVISFQEKPDEATAQKYLESGEYLWNSGMFIWKASLILKKIYDFVPDIYNNLVNIGSAINTPAEQKTLRDVYPQIRKISIDYAVMEPGAANGDVLLIPCDCGWNDVGSWDMMDVLHESDENKNILLGDVKAINTKNSVVFSTSRMVTTVDVENIVVVETADAVMVCRKDKAQNVKLIVDELAKSERKELL